MKERDVKMFQVSLDAGFSPTLMSYAFFFGKNFRSRPIPNPKSRFKSVREVHFRERR